MMKHNMLIDPLPKIVSIGGTPYAINSDFRITIAFEILMQDPDIEDAQKARKALGLYYPIIPDDLDAAVDQICGSIREEKYTGRNRLGEVVHWI